MTNTGYNKNVKRQIWLDVSFSETSGAWVILPMHRPSNQKTRHVFMKVEGNQIIYWIAGFDHQWQADGFARTYHKVKNDGFVSRVRLD